MTAPVATAPPLDPDDPGFIRPDAPEGVTEAPAQSPIDYFGFSEQKRWYLPDGLSYMDVQVLNEGGKSIFQKKTQKDVVLERGSGNAKFRMDPSDERHELIKASVKDWYMTRNGQPVPFGARVLDDWLKLTNPKLVEDLESFIRKLNPWLQGDMTEEDIDQEIERLEELKKEVAERKAGEASSSNRQ